jgi:small GTP-binding protein
MLGDQGVGKTKMVRQFIGDDSSAEDGLTKTVILNCGDKVKLNIIDTAGMERHKSLPFNYYRQAEAAIIGFDCGNKESFTNINNWIKELRNHGENVPILLFGNNCDKTRQVTKEEVEELAKSQGVEVLCETNTKNENVDECVRKLANIIHKKRDGKIQDEASKAFMVGKPPQQSANKKGCC